MFAYSAPECFDYSHRTRFFLAKYTPLHLARKTESIESDKN